MKNQTRFGSRARRQATRTKQASRDIFAIPSLPEGSPMQASDDVAIQLFEGANKENPQPK